MPHCDLSALAGVFVDDRERRRGDLRRRHAEALREAARERRLARPELPGEVDDVARVEALPEATPLGFGLLDRRASNLAEGGACAHAAPPRPKTTPGPRQRVGELAREQSRIAETPLEEIAGGAMKIGAGPSRLLRVESRGEERSDRSREDVSGARGREQGRPGGVDRHPSRRRADQRPLPLEHDDRPGTADESADRSEPVGLDRLRARAEQTRALRPDAASGPSGVRAGEIARGIAGEDVQAHRRRRRRAGVNGAARPRTHALAPTIRAPGRRPRRRSLRDAARIARPDSLARPPFLPSSATVIASGRDATTAAATAAVENTVTRPAPARSAPRAARTAAPALPRGSGEDRDAPEVPLVGIGGTGG